MVLSNSQAENPFDRSVPARLQITATIGPTVLPSLTTKAVETLVDIAGFDFLQLTLLAVDTESAARLRESSCEVAQVQVDGDIVKLEAPTWSSSLGSRRLLEDLQAAVSDLLKHSEVEYLFSRSPHRSDYLVGDRRAIEAQPGRQPDPKYCTLDDCLNRVRLLCVAHRRFEVSPKYHVNEGFYNMYRRDRLFPEFRRAWFYGRHLAEERLDGLWRRLEFVSRAADLAMISAYQTPNNDTDDTCLYHLGYQYMLCTGVFDDLAALANIFYELGLDRYDVTLRQRKGKSPIAQAVRSQNADLSDFLEDTRMASAIESFYPIRDRLQHREFPKTMGVVTGRQDRLPSLMLAPEIALRNLAAGIGDASAPINPWVDKGDEATVTLVWLCSATLEAMVRIVNGYLSVIPWEERTGRAVSSRQGRDALWHRFLNGPGKFLGWRREPLLFDYGVPEVSGS